MVSIEFYLIFQYYLSNSISCIYTRIVHVHEIELNKIVLQKIQSRKKPIAKDEMRMLLSYTVCSLFLVRDVKAYACKGNGVNSSAHN